MSLHIGTLYHWSRKANRQSIMRDGLRILEPCSDGIPWRAPYICLGSTPSSAWSLLPRLDDPEEPGEPDTFDLWQVQVREGDDLQIRGDFSPFIREVRVLHGLPPDRVWWAGEREAP